MATENTKTWTQSAAQPRAIRVGKEGLEEIERYER